MPYYDPYQGVSDLLTGIGRAIRRTKDKEERQELEALQARLEGMARLEEQSKYTGNPQDLVKAGLRSPYEYALAQERMGFQGPQAMSDFARLGKVEPMGQSLIGGQMATAALPGGPAPNGQTYTPGTIDTGGSAINRPMPVQEAPPPMPSTPGGIQARSMQDIMAGRQINPMQESTLGDMGVLPPNIQQQQALWDKEYYKLDIEDRPDFIRRNPPPSGVTPGEETTKKRVSPRSVSEMAEFDERYPHATPEEREAVATGKALPTSLRAQPKKRSLSANEVLTLVKAYPGISEETVQQFINDPDSVPKELIEGMRPGARADLIKPESKIAPSQLHLLFEPNSITMADIDFANKYGSIRPDTTMTPLKVDKTPNIGTINLAEEMVRSAPGMTLPNGRLMTVPDVLQMLSDPSRVHELPWEALVLTRSNKEAIGQLLKEIQTLEKNVPNLAGRDKKSRLKELRQQLASYFRLDADANAMTLRRIESTGIALLRGESVANSAPAGAPIVGRSPIKTPEDVATERKGPATSGYINNLYNTLR